MVWDVLESFCNILVNDYLRLIVTLWQKSKINKK